MVYIKLRPFTRTYFITVIVYVYFTFRIKKGSKIVNFFKKINSEIQIGGKCNFCPFLLTVLAFGFSTRTVKTLIRLSHR